MVNSRERLRPGNQCIGEEYFATAMCSLSCLSSCSLPLLEKTLDFGCLAPCLGFALRTLLMSFVGERIQ